MKAEWPAERWVDIYTRPPYYYDDLEKLAREAIALLRRAQLHIGREPHDAIRAVALQDLGLDMDKFLDGEP